MRAAHLEDDARDGGSRLGEPRPLEAPLLQDRIPLAQIKAKTAGVHVRHVGAPCACKKTMESKGPPQQELVLQACLMFSLISSI